jgi:pimeloyl-ACP methyl ester carboxylesterase
VTGPAPSGPLPILLLHGALGGRDQLAPLAEALAEVVDAPVRALEFAGHGGTPPDAADAAGYAIERLSAQVARALGGPAVLFGYSMGGYAALHLAAEAPARVAGVVTLGTKLAWTPEYAAREAARLDAAVIRAKVPAFADALARRHAGAGGWEGVLARTAGLLTALGADPLLSPARLAAVACPVRLLAGDRDATLSAAECEAAAGALPRGEFRVLPDTPHPLEQVDARRLAREVAEVYAAARAALPAIGPV